MTTPLTTALTTALTTGKIAGAPISWGVCEVPGWGYQLAAGRVLTEMRELGLTATEFGPDGYLPADPAERTRLLRQHDLTAAGGFVPAVLHDPAIDPLTDVDRALDGFGPAQEDGPVLVLAAATGVDGYQGRPALDATGWRTLLANLDRVMARAAERGYVTTLHPHVGTMVEKQDEVHRVLDGSAVRICLDTGHLLIGGTDPAELARQAPHRIGHVHLKDVEAATARRVTGKQISYTEGVAAGLYQPLGQGDVDVKGVVSALEVSGYQGWYVLEQDTILPVAPDGDGPVANVRQSLNYLRTLL
jgi:inosose dehydratase